MTPRELAAHLQIEAETLAAYGKDSPAILGCAKRLLLLADSVRTLQNQNLPRLTVKPLTEPPARVNIDDNMQATSRGLAISKSRAVTSPNEAAIRKLAELGHSVSSAAREIGVSPGMLSNVLSGNKRLGAEKAAKLAKLMAKKPKS